MMIGTRCGRQLFLCVGVLSLAASRAVAAPSSGGGKSGGGGHKHSRHVRQTLFGTAGGVLGSGTNLLSPAHFPPITASADSADSSAGCPDAHLFSYLLYYYLIQSQSGREQHARADQMASALLRLRTARGTDPVPTLISTDYGQAALLTLLRNVAQNNPNRLLQLLGSVQQPSLQQLQKQQQQQQRELQRQAARTLATAPTVQDHFHRQSSRDGGGSHHLTPAREEILDNLLHFSPSLRQQVYAPQPSGPTDNSPNQQHRDIRQQESIRSDGSVRTVVKQPTTRLQVSTITTVTRVVNTHASLVPVLLNGGQSSGSRIIVATSTHLITATKLQTLAVVVTPTVLHSHGRTTTLYNQDATANAEIITDLSYTDEDDRSPDPLVGSLAQSGWKAAEATPVLLLPTSSAVVDTEHKQATEAAIFYEEDTDTTTPAVTTTTQPKSQLLALLKSRAEARKRGVPYRRSRSGNRSHRNNIVTENKSPQATSNARHEPDYASTSQTTTTTTTTTTAATSTTPQQTTRFQPQQVPVYVERDGVLIILPSNSVGAQDLAPVYGTSTTSGTTSKPVQSTEPTEQPTISPTEYVPFDFEDLEETVYAVPSSDPNAKEGSSMSLHLSGGGSSVNDHHSDPLVSVSYAISTSISDR